VHFVAGGEGEELDDQTRAFARPAGGVEIDAIDYDAERAEQIQFEAGQKGPRRGHEISILAVITPIVEGQGISVLAGGNFICRWSKETTIYLGG
jgi:hypothetical protein